MSKLVPIEPEYVYMTIPVSWVCVYHRILAMLADYGEDMLKDCKAACTDRNSNVIECFNMFNAAIAARKIGKDKLAETLIKYIKAKITQIYKGIDNCTESFIYPIDSHGHIKAIISCKGDDVKFKVTEEDAHLIQTIMDKDCNEHLSSEIDDNGHLIITKDNETYKRR